MSKRNSHLLCLCGSFLNFDHSEYYCRNCGRVRFSRYVSNGNGETDLIKAFDLVSKDIIRVVDEEVAEQMSEFYYFAIIYTFKKKGQDYTLIDVKETRKVWEDTDPQIISDEIELRREERDVDFYFCKE